MMLKIINNTRIGSREPALLPINSNMAFTIKRHPQTEKQLSNLIGVEIKALAWSNMVQLTKEVLKKITSLLKHTKKVRGERARTTINQSLTTERMIKISRIQIEIQQCKIALKISGQLRGVPLKAKTLIRIMDEVTTNKTQNSTASSATILLRRNNLKSASPLNKITT